MTRPHPYRPPLPPPPAALIRVDTCDTRSYTFRETRTATTQHLRGRRWLHTSATAHWTQFTAYWTYTFSAKERDPETGLSYFGSRYYSSDLSIWLSVDPMSDKYPSLSPYVYCADNPVKLVDPNGDTIRFDTDEDRRFVQSLLNRDNEKTYSKEFEEIYDKLESSEHIYTFCITYNNGKEEGEFWNVDDNNSEIHYSINSYDENYGASKYRNLFEETYHAYQYNALRRVINSCYSEASAWKFSSLAPGTLYLTNSFGKTVMARFRDYSVLRLAFELKFGMLPNEEYCGTEKSYGHGRYYDFPLIAPEEKVFFPFSFPF